MEASGRVEVPVALNGIPRQAVYLGSSPHGMGPIPSGCVSSMSMLSLLSAPSRRKKPITAHSAGDKEGTRERVGMLLPFYASSSKIGRRKSDLMSFTVL